MLITLRIEIDLSALLHGMKHRSRDACDVESWLQACSKKIILQTHLRDRFPQSACSCCLGIARQRGMLAVNRSYCLNAGQTGMSATQNAESASYVAAKLVQPPSSWGQCSEGRGVPAFLP